MENAQNPSRCCTHYMETTVCLKCFVHVCSVFWGRLSDVHMVSVVLRHSWLPLTWHIGQGLGEKSGESLIPHTVFIVSSFVGLHFFVWSFLSISVDQAQWIRITPTSVLFCPSYLPSLAPHPPLAPSRCVNQYTLLTHDSPHMFSAQGLHLGAEIVRMCVCSHDWVQLWCALSLILSLFIFVRAHTCVCVHVCEPENPPGLPGLSPKGCCCRLKSTSSPHEWTH